MSRVYVVSYGEQCEGGEVKSIHATEAGARAAVEKLLSDEYLPFKGRWEETCSNVWYGGCDFIDIEAFEVQD